MLNGAKPLSNSNSWAGEGQSKALNEAFRSERSPMKTTLRRTEPKNAKKNNKTTRKNSSDRRRPS